MIIWKQEGGRGGAFGVFESSGRDGRCYWRSKNPNSGVLNASSVTDTRDIPRFIIPVRWRRPQPKSKPDRAQTEYRSTRRANTRFDLTCGSSQFIIHSNALDNTTDTSYEQPPLGDVTIEEFELFAIDRLRVLGEIESCWARNRPQEELKSVVADQCVKYLPLNNNSAKTVELDEQRRKDHIGHFVLRLAFCRS